MISFFQHLFDTTGFPPRWNCGQWTDGHGWLHIISDFAIFGAYAAIPLALAYFIWRRKDVPFIPVFWLFAVFIVSCGFSHLIEATIFWHPWYRLSGVVKAVTAVVSWMTVIALLKVIPTALALPGLARVNRQLTEEIAERKQAENALRKSEEFSRTVLQSSPDCVKVLSADGVVILLNEPGSCLLELDDMAQIIGKTWWDLFPEEGRARVRDAVTRARQGQVSRFEEFCPTAKGTPRWWDVQVSPVRSADGSVERVVAVSRDMTERKQAEEVAVRLAAIVASSDDAIIGKDLHGIVTSWNAGAEKVYGYTAAEMVGQPILRIIPPDRHHEEADILDHLRRGEPIDHADAVRLRKDGSTVEVSVTVSPIKDASGRIIGASKVARDITAQKRAERIIVEEAKRKDEFLAMLGHELRNPLNAIRHAVQISAESADDADAAQWAAQVIDRQSQQLSRMVDDLLDVARINRGRIELRVESLDLRPVLEQAVASVRPLITQRRHSCTVEIGDGLRVTGDAARLEQVFVNVLTNAAKYTPEGGRLLLRARCEEAQIIVSITDNGAGISSELLPHVFDLFRQAESTLDRAQGGLGIGLSVVKSLVEMHFGRVVVESAGCNLGTTVTVRLPLLVEESAPAPAPPLVAPRDAAPTAVRVLIVDDHEDAAHALGRLLARRGCDIRLAYNGPAALIAAREFLPEILLLDLGLPGLDGYELTRILRAESPFTSALFIALSGYAQGSDRQRCFAAGFDEHLAKPIDFSALMAAIRSRYPA